ncbi:extracellular solute-binding protein [Rhodovastum sp. RN2-1]|uniref:Extracellular solute-binding protein n=2 Tax=Limobrevibacterium gyesilva TaxID=2991712 RepID=A0AA41YIJ2_9PROT|nr:extracellular solute-binding protein [Limobrevibacterium gyesilva]
MMGKIGRRTLLTGAAALAAAPRAHAAGQVVVGTWGGDYAALLAENIDKPLLAPKGIEVVQDVAPQDPRKAKLTAERASRRGTMDVACLSDVDSASMSLLNVWEPVTAEAVPNLPHVLPALRTPYSIPHIYSGLVILYNPDKIKTPPKSYTDFWDPKYKGRVGFVDILYLYNIAAAALAHGGSMNNFEPGKPALRDLKRLEPKIYPSNEAMATALKAEEVWMTPMWLARGVFWRKGGVNVAHAVPSEGATPYISAAAVPKNAQNKANGMAYLNAMLDPRAQVAFAERMSYAPTVDNAPVPAELMQQIGFTPEQQANFKNPDYDYMAKNTSQLNDFWNRDFKS